MRAPTQFADCPLPHHPLRNGRLNQTAYSLYLFIRDIAGGDIVSWIDGQLTGNRESGNLAAARSALVDPLRHVYGISDKVIGMALASLLMGAGRNRPGWFAVGATFIVVDTLVHNFLHRTGVLARVGATHPYGPSCYGPAGAATSCSPLPRGLMPAGTTQPFRRCFPGSSNMRCGGTAPRRASISATATRSMIGPGARICGATCTATVTGSFCTPTQKIQ